MNTAINTQELILGSSSPARRALLTRLQLPFKIVVPDADETPLPNEDGQSLVLRLAAEKARIISKQHPDALIIGADQVGTFEGHLLNKPLTLETAAAQLRLVSGKMVRFFTGLCLLNARTGKQSLAVETYDVYFRELTDPMIHDYLQKENVLNCAGSFQAEGLGITLIKKFDGEDYTALIGLPLIRLSSMLEEENINTSTAY